MKYILLVTALFTIVSCGISANDKDRINFFINFHNTNVYGDFQLDSIRHDGDLRINYIDLKNSPQLISYLESSGQVYKNNWNKPYSISKDYELTFDKYLEYCKANNKDIKTYYKFID